MRSVGDRKVMKYQIPLSPSNLHEYFQDVFVNKLWRIFLKKRKRVLMTAWILELQTLILFSTSTFGSVFGIPGS